MADDRKYQHGVVDIAAYIVAIHRGTTDGCSAEDFSRLREWLDWRTSTAGWSEPSSKYDDCVWELAMAALQETAPEEETVE